MKIMLVIHSMMAGGAERVAATLVNYWTAQGEQVTLLTVASSAADFYDLDPRINRIGLDLGGPSPGWRRFVASNFRIIRGIRSAIRGVRPDVVLSFMDVVNLRVLLAAAGTGVPVVVEEHTDPTVYSIGSMRAALRRLLYPRASALVVLTERIAEWAKEIVSESSVRVIPNPVGDQFLMGRAAAQQCAHTAVAVGRLVSEKGFDLLLRAFAQCAQTHPDWRLQIVGEGPERTNLKRLGDELGIGGRVELAGAVKETQVALQQSDLFVLSSRFEGFPMALLEAMACGLPVISFDCRSGPREMIQDGVNGRLVPPNDVAALAAAMSQLMGSGDERARLGQRAAAAAERFRLGRIDQMWRSVFEQALSSAQT